jgi:hypothetical protein
MEVAEGHRPFEGREDHRFVAEAALKKAGKQVGQAGERVGALDLDRLRDDENLQGAEQQHGRAQREPDLVGRTAEQRDHRGAPL